MSDDGWKKTRGILKPYLDENKMTDKPDLRTAIETIQATGTLAVVPVDNDNITSNMCYAFINTRGNIDLAISAAIKAAPDIDELVEMGEQNDKE